ncbi:DNA ligase D [Paraburkholderia sp. UCT31]|nr:DNA ligase D [Paraburkholderia sp. UCT31]
MPDAIAPQLATLASGAPTSGEWTYELKFDGYRFMARLDGGDVCLFTRNQHDWTVRLPRQAHALKQLELENAWLDGEMVMLNDAGLPDFGALQNAMAVRKTDPVVYFVFDLLFLNGRDLRKLPLKQRRAILRDLLTECDAPELRYSEDFPHDVKDILASAYKLELEGVVGKRADAPYTSGRSNSWIKLKCRLRQEFVIGGFSALAGSSSDIRGLLLGLYDSTGSLQYVGSVALTGKAAHLRPIRESLIAARTTRSPFSKRLRVERDRDYHWLNPSLVAEVSFLEWTRTDTLRQPTFHGLRFDKPASSIVRESAADEKTPTESAEDAVDTKSRRPSPATVGSVRVTNASRCIDTTSGLTKLDLVRYYESIAEWAMPHLDDRPVSLVRAPTGIHGELFFQKHAEGMTFPGMNQLPAELFPGHGPLLNIHRPDALIGAAQMGTIELHTWNASQPDLEHPDRMIFDLDPDPALPWERMREAALLTKVILDELGLQSWIKTSGGKGFHVVVPLTGKQDWTTVKSFSHSVAKHLAKVVPERFVAVLGPKNRVGKIFVDYLRNGKAQSTAAAFSVRARPGLAVSMPIDWDEVKSVKSGDQWSMKSAVERMKLMRNDPWKHYWLARQTITPAMRRLLG